nr:hypothetical protein [Tanacetum cinerariifolium]
MEGFEKIVKETWIDVVAVVRDFFYSSTFPRGCNSSFIALIPKSQDSNLVKDYRPISLIKSVYKIIAKILANRLSLMIDDLIVKSNQLLFLIDKFSMGLSFSMNFFPGSFEHVAFQGYLFNYSLTLSHLLYADDAVFVGEWDRSNIKILVHVLKCFFLASGLKINLQKSKLMGVGINKKEVDNAAQLNSLWAKFITAIHGLSALDVTNLPVRMSIWQLIYALELDKNVSLADKKKALDLSFRFTPRAGAWSLNSSNEFSVKSVRNYFNDILLLKVSVPTRWVKVMPIKRRKLPPIYSSPASWHVKCGAKYSAGGTLIPLIYTRMTIELDKNVSVADKKKALDISFRFTPRGGVEEEQFKALHSCITDLLLSQTRDH